MKVKIILGSLSYMISLFNLFSGSSMLP